MSLFGASVVLVNFIRVTSFDELKYKELPESLRNENESRNELLEENTSGVWGINQTKPVIATSVKTHKQTQPSRNLELHYIVAHTKKLLIDRWVGIEGVMAVSCYQELGWKLWKRALDEKFSYNEISFYDKNIILSPYRNTDTSKHHFISLPGVIAFFFYPGSYLFLFVCMLMTGVLAAIIEITTFKVAGNNIILCALFGQVVAYRLSNFGYVPTQSYLLLGALCLNIFIFYILIKVFNKYGESNEYTEQEKQHLS